jgi:hypothetical protein
MSSEEMPKTGVHLPLLKGIAASVDSCRLFFVIIAGTVFFLIPREYLGDAFPICLFRILFARECIGCGTTRALWSLLHLDVFAAYGHNRLIILTFPLLAGCAIKWVFASNASMGEVNYGRNNERGISSR